jgi:hypothetical protein
MKAASAIIGIFLFVTSLSGGAATADAAGLRISHRYAVWRIGPQDCFLMPDVVVALDALGPYCSSPRGYYRRYGRSHPPPQFPNVPVFGAFQNRPA